MSVRVLVVEDEENLLTLLRTMVDVTGAYVFDTSHGYYELHPIFKMATSSDNGQSCGETYTSGPQYGGPPRRASNSNAFALSPTRTGTIARATTHPNRA